MARCVKCRLHSTCRSVKVDGRGAEVPTIVFVGQAPGAQEDEQAKCFVGPAGQLLTQAIKEYGLRPAFLTNLTRCFPPNDRGPKPDEIAACSPYLLEEIKARNPKIVVALGGIVLKALTGKTGVTNYSGQIVGSIGNAKVFSLFHPSFILRYPRNLPKFEMHLRALRDLMGTEASAFAPKMELPKAELVSSAHVFKKLEKAEDFVTFDFETTGKFKQFGGKIRCCGFNINDENMVLSADDPGFSKLMKAFLQMKITKCAFNLTFEQRWCKDEFNMAAYNLAWDPMLMHYLVDENSAHDLESVASAVLHARQWDITSVFREKGWTYENVPMDVLVPYNGLDVHYTSELVEPLYQLMEEEKLLAPYRTVLLPLAHLCAKLQSCGMFIDSEWASKVDMQYSQTNLKSCNKMIEMLGLPEDFNPNSAKQIRDVLVNKLKLKTDRLTDSGKMSTKDSAIEPLKDKHPFIPVYLDWKQKATLCNNFLQKFPKYMDGNTYLIHPSFNPSFVVTGRLSVTNPNAQAIPVDPNVRGMFASRFLEGKVLSMDFDALEMRLLASEADETNLIEVFKKGVNPHDDTATRMFGANFDKTQRNIAKRINFGTVYGISDYALSREFNVSVQTAAKWLDDHKKAYPRIYAWMRTQHDFVRRHGYIRSKFGRVRHLPDIKAGTLPKWEHERILRQAGNYPIQSLGADITNVTAIRVDRALTSGGLKSLLFHQVHDSILIDVVPGELDAVQTLCNHVVDTLPDTFCCVKLTVSFQVGERWDN